jgi:hypothetical protein
MDCPRCGAENPDNAEFCSLCMQRLVYPQGGGIATGAGEGLSGARGRPSPAEWRPDVVGPRPRESGIVTEKIKKYRVSMAIYGMLLLALILWLALSFTVWGNPSPGKRASQIVSAVNSRDGEAFASLFAAQERSSAESLYARITDYIGTTGEFRDVRFRVEEKDPYTAHAYVKSGTVVLSGGASREITSEDGLVVSFEKRDGKWVAKVGGTKLIP